MVTIQRPGGGGEYPALTEDQDDAHALDAFAPVNAAPLPSVVMVAFGPVGTQYRDGYNITYTAEAFSAADIAAFQSSFARFSAVTNLSFQVVTDFA